MLLKTIFLIALVLASAIRAEDSPKVEQYGFNAEIARLMDIIINSLYTQKEIFLREVISNASDALDKIRFLALTDPDVLGSQKNLEIRIDIDEDEKVLSIRDTGIGMTKSELIQNLGTIAKSGTTNFLEALKSGNINLIGQFGVGFYSIFLAGSKVEVISKSNNDDQYVWTSDASSFKIYKDPNGDTLGRGTEVRIHLKEDALDFLKHKRVSKLVKKYSEFIDFPIYLNMKKEIEEEVAADTAKEGDEDVEVTEKKTETQKVKKTIYEWERLNTNKAIWLRDRNDIDDEEYIDFYKSISHQSNPPLNWIHFKAEGEIGFNSILYIPNRLPFDFYQTYNTRKNDLKLYVRRVLVTENKLDMLPKYLSFIQGVVDSDQLPLNVNRETLQQSKIFKLINQKVTKRVLDMVSEISKWDYVEDEQEEEEDFEDEDGETQQLTEEEKQKRREEARAKALQENKRKYDRFYSEFGKALKLGVIEDSTNRKKLAALTRWHTTHNTSEPTSLDDYITRMKKTQDQIYFFSGEDRKVLEKSPLVKGLVRKGYEVLLCDDPMDEYVFNTLNNYEGKNVVNVGKGNFKLPEDDETERKKQKVLTDMFNPYIEYAKKLLFEKVNSVILSNRLTTEPCVVVADSYGQSSFMEKIQRSQVFATEGSNPQSSMKKILEINPHHRINQIILERIKNNSTDSKTEEMIEILYESAALASGFALQDTNDFANKFYKVYSEALGVLNLKRNEDLSVDTNVELDEKDYEGDNEEIMRISPSEMTVGAAEEEE